MSIVFDAALAKRYRKARCTPGNKNCGKTCIPQDYSCGSEEQKGDHPMAAQNLARIEDEIRDKPIEYASAIDPRTGREIFRSKGNKDSVEIPEAVYPQLKGAIVTHNHPNLGNWPPSDPRSKGLSFSPADIKAASMLGVREIRAVSTGYNHSMVMPKNPVNVEASINRHKNRIYRELAIEGLFGKTDGKTAQVEFWHRLWTSVAKDNPGMTYKRTEVKKDSGDRIRTILSSRRAWTTFDSGISEKGVTPEQVKRLVAVILERSYGKGIQDVRINENLGGKIKGRFRDRTRIMEFLISEKAVSTRMVKDLIAKNDSVVIYQDSIEEEDDRFDATKSGSRGIKCGKSWISARKTCQIGIRQITTPRERQQLALALASPTGEMGTGPSIEDDPTMGIRDLQKEAARQGIPYANRMTKDQLRDTIRAYKSSPKSRELTYRALSKKKRAEESITNSQFAKDWKTANKILALAGSGGVVSAVAVAAILANRSVEEVERAQANYAENFQSGARQAKSKGDLLAKAAEPLSASQHHALFVVGGATGEEGRAKDIAKAMDDLAEEERQDRARRQAGPGKQPTDYDYPFADYLANSEVTRRQLFDPSKTDFDVPDEEKYDQSGRYRPEYLARLGIEGAALGRPDLGIKSAIIDRITGGKPKGGNEDAIDIAAQIYAHANAVRPSQRSLATMTPDELWKEVAEINKNMPADGQFPVPNGKKAKEVAEAQAVARNWLLNKGWVGSTTPNREKPIRIIAYGHGGKAVKEAMELIHAMGDPDRQILDQVTVAYISTPDFNFTKPRTREASFVSNQDPFSRFSHRSPERVAGGEKGTSRSVENYFSSGQFRSGLTTWMGFDGWRRTQQAAEAQRAEANARFRAQQAAATRAGNRAGAQASSPQNPAPQPSGPQSPSPGTTAQSRRPRKRGNKQANQQAGQQSNAATS